jgi:archaemetzincin
MVPIGDEVHRVACRLGLFSGKLRVGVDGAPPQVIKPEKLDAIGLHRRCPVRIAGRDAWLMLTPTMLLTTRIDLVVDGRSVESGEPVDTAPVRRNRRMLGFLAYYVLVAGVVSLALGPVTVPLIERFTYKGAWRPELGGRVSSIEDLHKIPALGEERRAAAESLLRQSLKLRPHFSPVELPGRRDWLYTNLELGQTFAEYVALSPLKIAEGRGTIYIRPVGDFSPEQRRVVELTAEFLGDFYGLPVKVTEVTPLGDLPAKARRHNSVTGTSQILTTHVANRLLKPTKPRDALFYLAFTSDDLWVGPLNFVYGQAFPRDGLGVWSIHRNGDPAGDADAFRLCLRRTVKTAAHEVGHLVGINHCTSFACCMCGSNHRAENDSRPLAFCPECVCKLLWMFEAGAAGRYAKLARFCRVNGLARDAAIFEKLERALKN